MDMETNRLVRRSMPLFSVLAAALLVLALGAILHLGRDIFVPIALAMLLSFVLAPAVRGLQRLALPQGLAVAATVLATVLTLGGLAMLVASQLASLGAEIPRFQSTIQGKIGALAGAASPEGTTARAMQVLAELGREVQKLMPGGSAGPGGEGVVRPVRVIVEEGGGVLGVLGGFVSPLLHPLATAFLVLIFVVFVLAAREDLRNRFIRLLGPEDIQHTTDVIDDAAGRLSRLFLMQLAVNAAFGVVISLGLWVIGIPSPILWGALAGVLRFVPYVGALASLLPPLALAIAVDPGWSMLLWTALLFVAIEPVIAHVLEPLLFGHSTGLSPLAVILAAAVWTFLWGPIGLVMATPLTVCLVVLGRRAAGLSFLDVMLGDRPALSPPQIFYQRMLAGDPSEAVLQARDFLRERALSTYYDEVALEALRLAHEDVARGRLTSERQEVLRHSTARLVETLGQRVRDPRPRGGQVGSEAAAAVLAVGPDRGAATEVIAPGELPAGWTGDGAALCLSRADTLDFVIADMLAQVLSKHGIPARSLAVGAGDLASGGQHLPAAAKIVCLSFVEPLSTLHLRHAVRLARRRYPGAAIIVGIWRDRDPAMSRMLGRAARSDSVVPTIGAVLATAVGIVRRTAEQPVRRQATPASPTVAA